MKFHVLRRTRPAILISTLVVLATSGGIAYAAIPTADGSVSGCYATSNGILLGIPHSKGDVRIVDSAERCRAYERAIAWNQHGVKGDQGLPGPAGSSEAPKSVLAQHDGTISVAPFPMTDVLSVDLPAGTWALVSKGVSYNFGISCELTTPAGDTVDRTESSFPVGDTSPFSLAGVASLATAGTVTLSCEGDATSHDSLVGLTSILAIAVTTS